MGDTRYTLNDVIRRNIVIDVLKEVRSRMKSAKSELDNIEVDGCHNGTHSFIVDEYSDMIKQADTLIDTIKHGDWCLDDESCNEIADSLEDKE